MKLSVDTGIIDWQALPIADCIAEFIAEFTHTTI